MTEKSFVYALRRGLGSAIIELKNNENRMQYRDAVLRCCLRDITFDWQTDGTRGYYLYTAICELGDKDYFEQIIIDRFLLRCSDRLFLQLASILFCYADDGSMLAKDAFHQKYDYFVLKNGRLSKNRSKDLDEGFQWDDVADKLFYIDGFAAFKRYAQDAGESLYRNPDNRNVYYDWFTNRAKEIFGEKRIDDYIEKMYGTSDAIRTLVDIIKADEASRESHQQGREQAAVTVDDLVKIAKEAALSENPPGKIMRYRQRFMKMASNAEILELANAAYCEEDKTIKGLLLRLFWHRPFPLDIAPLLQYVQSDNELLVEATVSILKEIKNKQIHDIAIMLLETKGLHSLALGLLKMNYKKSDDDIIFALIKKSSIPHHVQQDIRDIYLHHRSTTAYPILHRVYQRGECGFCRHGIVEAMQRCGVLTDDILEECQYDSNEDVRKYAKQVINRRR